MSGRAVLISQKDNQEKKNLIITLKFPKLMRNLYYIIL